LTVERSDVKLY